MTALGPTGQVASEDDDVLLGVSVNVADPPRTTTVAHRLPFRQVIVAEDADAGAVVASSMSQSTVCAGGLHAEDQTSAAIQLVTALGIRLLWRGGRRGAGRSSGAG